MATSDSSLPSEASRVELAVGEGGQEARSLSSRDQARA